MLTAVLALALLQQDPTSAPVQPQQPAPAPRIEATADGPRVEILHLGEDRQVRGTVVKETADAIYVDLGFDIVRVPIAAVVRRSEAERRATRSHDEGIFRTADLPELPVAAGARTVGPAVVKIETPTGSGSGFLTSPEGYVVTNFHVVDGELEVDVLLYLPEDGALRTHKLRDCKVLAQNPQIDLALVKIEPPEGIELPFVYVGDSEQVEVGQSVYAIGAPIGLDRTVTQGIVSVANRSFGGHTMLQIDVPINPGNSGGPLFDLSGRVVGVNSAGYQGFQGLNFAIPSKYVKDFLRNREAFSVDGKRNEDGIHFLPAPRRPGGEAKRDSTPAK